MKKTIIYLSLIAISLYSCKSGEQSDAQKKFITEIENNLLPRIIIEGEEAPGFNILERMEHYNVPGVSIAFLNKGEIQWAKGYGYADVDGKRKVDANTLFQAASISKPVAAMAALSLVEQGKIGLDDDVNQYMEGWQVEENNFTAEEKVTLRRLLSHSAGLTVHGFGGYSKTDTVPDILQVLNGAGTANSGRIFPDITPGTFYRYSGGGYTVMQKMLCDITGKDFPELMEELVLSPLGMESSTYMQPLPESKTEFAACAYNKDGALIPGRWHTYPEMAAAGLWTTPSDLLLYASEVQKSFAGKSDPILSREMTKEMLTPQMNSHGLGPAVGGEGEHITFSHGGANEGYRCTLFAYTLKNQAVAIMTNSDNGGTLSSEILRSFSRALDWPAYKPQIRSVIKLEVEELNTYSGNYLMEWQGEELIISLSSNDGYLDGFQLWDDFSFKLYPEAEDNFFGFHDGVPFDFQRDEDGNISSITIHEGSNTYHFKKTE